MSGKGNTKNILATLSAAEMKKNEEQVVDTSTSEQSFTGSRLPPLASGSKAMTEDDEIETIANNDEVVFIGAPYTRPTPAWPTGTARRALPSLSGSSLGSTPNASQRTSPMLSARLSESFLEPRGPRNNQLASLSPAQMARLNIMNPSSLSQSGSPVFLTQQAGSPVSPSSLQQRNNGALPPLARSPVHGPNLLRASFADGEQLSHNARRQSENVSIMLFGHPGERDSVLPNSRPPTTIADFQFDDEAADRSSPVLEK